MPEISELATMASIIKNLRSTQHVPADFTVLCPNQSFPVHKFVLAAKSDHFKTLFHGSSSYAENERNETKLDNDPNVVNAIIDLMYKEDYEYVEDWNYHAQISGLADYLQIPQVNTLIMTKICSQPKTKPLLYTTEGKKLILRSDEMFLRAMKTIYENSARLENQQAQRVIAELFSDNFPDVYSQPYVAKWLQETGDLLLRMMQLQRCEKKMRVQCPRCAKVEYFEAGKVTVHDLIPDDQKGDNFNMVEISPYSYVGHTTTCGACDMNLPTLRWLDSWLTKSGRV